MSFGFDMGVEGGDSLDGIVIGLKNLPLHLTGNVFQKALKKAIKPLKDKIDASTPVRTGKLKKTLRDAPTKFKKNGEHQRVVGFRKGRDKDGELLQGFVAHFLEYGTQDIAATPFMRPADEATKDEQERIFIGELQKEVDSRIDGL